jgi:hypothetical protein
MAETRERGVNKRCGGCTIHVGVERHCKDRKLVKLHGMVVELDDVMNYGKFHFDRATGLSSSRYSCVVFPLENEVIRNTACIARPCVYCNPSELM